MKSAIELAMEKARGLEGRKELTDDQKARITEARSIAEAKMAEIRIMFDDKISKMGGALQAIDEAKGNFARDRAKIENAMEKKIRSIREE